jgi:transposase
MYTVGLDVHSARSNLCILDDHGKKLRERVVRGSPREVVKELGRLGRPFNICYEASTSCGWLYDQLRPLANHVAVAHPGQLRLIFRSKSKNDRVDAAKLAKLLYLDEVPCAYVPARPVRAWRGMIEHRQRLVQKRTGTKNNLRAILRSQAIAAPPKKRLWTIKGLAWLAQLELGDPGDALRRDMLLEEYEHFEGQIARVTEELDGIARRHPGVVLLRTIPGVGPRTAEAFAAYVDDPRRFRRTKCVGSYFGLVPAQDQSGSANRLGHITRQGPGTVRGLLVEAAWRGTKSSPSLKAFFDRVTGGDKDRRKIALVATAHHLARVMLAMLKANTPWQERLAEAAEPMPTATH